MDTHPLPRPDRADYDLLGFVHEPYASVNRLKAYLNEDGQRLVHHGLTDKELADLGRWWQRVERRKARQGCPLDKR